MKKKVKRRSPLKFNNRERLLLLYALDLAWRVARNEVSPTYAEAVKLGILKYDLNALGQKLADVVEFDGVIPKGFLGK